VFAAFKKNPKQHIASGRKFSFELPAGLA